jgi:hypothetical protein
MKSDTETWALFVDETGSFSEPKPWACAVAGILLPDVAVPAFDRDLKARLQARYSWLPWPMHATDMRCHVWMLARALDVSPTTVPHLAHQQAWRIRELLEVCAPGSLVTELNRMVQDQTLRTDATVRQLGRLLERRVSERWAQFCEHMDDLVADVRLVMRDAMEQAARFSGMPVHVLAVTWSGEGAPGAAWLDAYSALVRRAIALLAGRTAALPGIHVATYVQALNVDCPTTGQRVRVNPSYLHRSYDPDWAEKFEHQHGMRVHWSCAGIEPYRGHLGGAWVMADWVANGMNGLTSQRRLELSKMEERGVTTWGAQPRGVQGRAAVGATGQAHQLVSELLLGQRQQVEDADLQAIPGVWAREQIQTFVPEGR